MNRCIAPPAVNYICSRRDGMSRRDAFREAYMFFLIKLIPNLIRKIKGVPSDLSLIDDTWVGHFAREERKSHPEVRTIRTRYFWLKIP